MGVRFRKSVKICKGVRINFSKSGASLSLGGQGHTVTYGPRGTRVTVGIPGTGLSYSTNIGSGKSKAPAHNNASKSRSKNTTDVAIPSGLRLRMDKDGKVKIEDSNGCEITDPSVLRKIKSTDVYKKKLQDLEEQRQTLLEEAYNNSQAENAKFVEIHKLSPVVLKKDDYKQDLDNLKAPVYVRKQYEVPYPTEETVREQLNQEAQEIVHGNFLTIRRKRKEYVETNYQERINQEIIKWSREKAALDAEEDENEILATEKYNAELNEKRQYLIELIKGEEDVVCEAVETWISSCELPVEINVDYDWRQAEHAMFLDVDLPEIEDLPTNEMVRLASGNLREKKKTQATLKSEYVNLVFGLAIFISANIFNVSPAILEIVFSGYTQRRNKDGDVNDEYVYSIKFTRNLFENTPLKTVNPKDFCMEFENRCNITSGMLMKRIKPFE